jgi:hypothetical protein
MLIAGLIIIAVSLIMSGYHAWLQGGGPVDLRYSCATIFMCCFSLGILLSWAYFGVPK